MCADFLHFSVDVSASQQCICSPEISMNSFRVRVRVRVRVRNIKGRNILQ
jgi:hypothetical protein